MFHIYIGLAYLVRTPPIMLVVGAAGTGCADDCWSVVKILRCGGQDIVVISEVIHLWFVI